MSERTYWRMPGGVVFDRPDGGSIHRGERVRVLTDDELAAEKAKWQAEWVAWLVEAGYPFDFNATPPPPVDAQALADRWNEADDWQVTPEQALDCILAESNLAREKGSDDGR